MGKKMPKCVFLCRLNFYQAILILQPRIFPKQVEFIVIVKTLFILCLCQPCERKVSSLLAFESVIVCISYDGHVTEPCIWGFAHASAIWPAHMITASLMISRVVCGSWCFVCVYVCVWEHVPPRMLSLCVPDLWHACAVFVTALYVWVQLNRSTSHDNHEMFSVLVCARYAFVCTYLWSFLLLKFVCVFADCVWFKIKHWFKKIKNWHFSLGTFWHETVGKAEV